ncbi:MAG: hypothetical protein ACI9HE_003717 [Planctomycetota bacterium]
MGREWLARARALDPVTHAAALQAELAAPDWTRAYAAMDALARTPAGARFAHGQARETVLLALHSEHSNLRAAAWRLMLAMDAVQACEVEVPGLAAGATDEELRAWSTWLTQSVGVPLEGQLGAGRAAAQLLEYLAAGEQDFAVLSVNSGVLDPLSALATAGPGAGAAQAAWLAPGGVLQTKRMDAFLGPWLRHPSDAGLVRGLRAVLPVAGALDAEAADWRGLVEGLALVLHDPGLPPLATLFVDALPAGAHLGVDRAGAWSRARRVGFVASVLARAGAPLGVRLLETALALPVDHELREVLLEAAGEALPATLALPLALELSAVDAALLWRSVEGRARPVPVPLLKPWLESGRPADLRFAAAQELARGLDAEDGRLRAEQLLGFVNCDDASLRIASFRWLTEASGSAPNALVSWAELYQKWAALPSGPALERLADLPQREAAGPFQNVFLQLLLDPATRTRGRIERLRWRRADPEVREALLRVYGEELRAALDPAVDAAQRRNRRGLAHACLRAAGPEALPYVRLAQDLSALIRQVDPDVERRSSALAELLIVGLGRSAGGREFLQSHLRAPTEWPRRERVEAFLQLAAHGDGELSVVGGPQILGADFERCDGLLRERIVSALAASALPSQAFLLALARNLETDELLAESAMKSLVRRGGEADVASVLQGSFGYERRQAAARALSAGEGEAATLILRGSLPVGLANPEGTERLLELSLLACLDARGALTDDLLGRLWSGPLAAGAQDLERRFRGLGRTGMGFRWRGELELVKRLARAGRLGAALEQCPDAWRLDGRFLAAAASAANGAKPGCEGSGLLARLALVALEGEGPSRNSALAEVRARTLLLDAAERSGDRVAEAFHADRLALAMRAGGAPAREVVRLGRFPDAYEAHRELQAQRLLARAAREESAGREGNAQRLRALAGLAH